MKKVTFLISALFLFISPLFSQHISEYLIDIYDQSWILDKKITKISRASYSISKNKYMGLEFDCEFINGIKATHMLLEFNSKLKKTAEIEKFKDGFKICVEGLCNTHYYNIETGLLRQYDGKAVTIYYAYDNKNRLLGTVRESKAGTKGKFNPLLMGRTVSKFERDRQGKLVKKIEYDVDNSNDLRPKMINDLVNNTNSYQKGVWEYTYDSQGLVEKITISRRAKKDSELKLFRTITIKHGANGFPSQDTWYAGAMTKKNLRYTRVFTYEYLEEGVVMELENCLEH